MKPSATTSEGPGIEDFQIVGEAVPGEKLTACGYSVRGTASCFFQVNSICSQLILFLPIASSDEDIEFILASYYVCTSGFIIHRMAQGSTSRVSTLLEFLHFGSILAQK